MSAFLSFKGLTHAYLGKISVTHNKYLAPWFLEDDNSILAKYAAQILSLNLAQAFLLLNFLITSFCNFGAGSTLTVAPASFFLPINL